MKEIKSSGQRREYKQLRKSKTEMSIILKNDVKKHKKPVFLKPQQRIIGNRDSKDEETLKELLQDCAGYNFEITSRALTDLIMIRGTRTQVIQRKFQKKNSFKRFINTKCPFQMAIKVYKDVTDAFTCNIELKHRHNHPINSLETFSYKTVSDEVIKREFN